MESVESHNQIVNVQLILLISINKATSTRIFFFRNSFRLSLKLQIYLFVRSENKFKKIIIKQVNKNNGQVVPPFQNTPLFHKYK